MLIAENKGKKTIVNTKVELDKYIEDGFMIYDDVKEEVVAENNDVIADEIAPIPTDVTEVRNIFREAICLMLGISIDADDETLLNKAKEFGGK